MSDFDHRGDLDKLRALLLSEEKKRLELIERRLTDPELRARDISKVLPQSVRYASQDDDKLANALYAQTKKTMHRVFTEDRDHFAETLYPVIGPAIKKSIGQTLKTFVEDLNRTLELSLSPKSIGWRIEAMRTGNSFAEIVFKNTMRYRVEQAFLIHRESGLLIEHVTDNKAVDKDSDAVSAMLTAIQDFVRDSFADSGGELDQVEVGDQTVWLLRGPNTLMAAVLRGMPPRQLREELQGLLQRIEDQYSGPLYSFRGNKTGFDGLDSILATALQSEFKPADNNSKKTADKKISPLLVGLGILVAVGLAFLLYKAISSHYETRRIETLVSTLQSAPGIAIINSEKSEGVWRISGLRDPLAHEPAHYAAQLSLQDFPINYSMTPYQSLESGFVIERARRQLRVPVSVTLNLKNGVLYATGTADAEWKKTAQNAHILPAGIAAFKLDDVITDADIVQEQPEENIEAQIQILAEKLRTTHVYFSEGTKLTPEGVNNLDRAYNLIQQLVDIDNRKKLGLVITLVGNSDNAGNRHRNVELRLKRSRLIKDHLVKRGIPDPYLRAMALNRFPLSVQSNALQRRVEFRIAVKGS